MDFLLLPSYIQIICLKTAVFHHCFPQSHIQVMNSHDLLSHISLISQISSGWYHFDTPIQLCPSSLSLSFSNGL